MGDFSINSLRGGVNNSDPAISLPDDQCTVAENVEFIRSMLGERRRGMTPIDIPAELSVMDRVTFLHRHLPSSSESDSELWAISTTGNPPVSYTISRKTDSWSEITITGKDTFILDDPSTYQISAQSLHGKLFFALNGADGRLFVWDGGISPFDTQIRRASMYPPNAPTVENSGDAGTFTGTRYYRYRYIHQTSSISDRRSEPSERVDLTPTGTNDGLIITRTSLLDDGETHWELEASLDDANYYRIATIPVGTDTYLDTQDYVTGYAQDFPLSADIGDYTPLLSCKYLAADDDRLLMAGSWDNEQLASRVSWTPVYTAEGMGNDERLELDTDPFLNLDGFEGGPITGMSKATAGTIWVFKTSHIYKLIRTGLRSRAYDVVVITKDRGALHGSIVSGIDQLGTPCVYFLDPNMGPCRAGVNGIQQCGADIRATWTTINTIANQVVCSAVYFPEERQVQWAVATGESNTPNLMLILQVNETRGTEDGVRRGWSFWTGDRAKAMAMCLYADNIDDNTDRNRTLRSFIATEGLGLIHRCGTVDDTDSGTSYIAKITSKPYAPRSILHFFAVMAGMLLAKAVSGASLTISAIRDFGKETISIEDVSCAPEGNETQVFKQLDNLNFSELRTVQMEFKDAAGQQDRWELNRFALLESKGQTS